MGNKARNYTNKTLKRLFALSGNQCAFPGCEKRIVNEKNAKDSNICHIQAASKDGERYNSLMTDEQRADYPNLILLCIQHHDKTNDVAKYTVGVMEDMKQQHESYLLNEKFRNNPSMLKNTINALSNINMENIHDTEETAVFNIKDKIDFNSIKRNIAIIQEYKVYHQKINSLYDELELQGSIKKEKLLSVIKLTYAKIKGEYVLNSEDTVGIIRQNSDNIIDDIYDELYEKIQNSDLWDEDVILGIRLIMVDAFMRCKILEEPKK
jgi:hypothetical protein